MSIHIRISPRVIIRMIVPCKYLLICCCCANCYVFKTIIVLLVTLAHNIICSLCLLLHHTYVVPNSPRMPRRKCSQDVLDVPTLTSNTFTIITAQPITLINGLRQPLPASPPSFRMVTLTSRGMEWTDVLKQSRRCVSSVSKMYRIKTYDYCVIDLMFAHINLYLCSTNRAQPT